MPSEKERDINLEQPVFANIREQNNANKQLHDNSAAAFRMNPFTRVECDAPCLAFHCSLAGDAKHFHIQVSSYTSKSCLSGTK